MSRKGCGGRGGAEAEAAVINPKHTLSSIQRHVALWLCARVARTAKATPRATNRGGSLQVADAATRKRGPRNSQGGKKDVLYWKAAAADACAHGRLADVQTAKQQERTSKHVRACQRLTARSCPRLDGVLAAQHGSVAAYLPQVRVELEQQRRGAYVRLRLERETADKPCLWGPLARAGSVPEVTGSA